MNLSNLEKIFSDKKPFQLKQAKEAVFGNLIEDWNEATNLSAGLREKLNQECPLNINAEIFESKDKTTAKALITLNDGLKIETVLMRHKDAFRQVSTPSLTRGTQGINSRNTVCVSSQVGCPMGCLFCATGKLGFKRNLEALEIVEQVLLFARLLKKESKRVDNIVFMGMGEPFLNYDNVLAAIRILNDPKSLAIGSRHISISTIGIVEGIEKLTNEKIQVNLAISLHAPNDELRAKIVPANKKYSIDKILSVTNAYIKKTNRKVMLEYIMIKGLNDSETQARELISLIKKLNEPLYFVNLIAYNETGDFESSNVSTVKKFHDFLMDNGVACTQRFRFGEDIQGACGQLAGKK